MSLVINCLYSKQGRRFFYWRARSILSVGVDSIILYKLRYYSMYVPLYLLLSKFFIHKNASSKSLLFTKLALQWSVRPLGISSKDGWLDIFLFVYFKRMWEKFNKIIRIVNFRQGLFNGPAQYLDHLARPLFSCGILVKEPFKTVNLEALHLIVWFLGLVTVLG